MTVATAQLSESLQTLIDSRLDTIDRVLLGRLSRQDRLAIVSEVESQIQELLQERQSEELTRENLLAVLARLDPPEAYIPDESENSVGPARRTMPSRPERATRQGDQKVGRVSAILGLAALTLMLVLPVDYLIAVALNSSTLAIVLFVGNLLLMFCASVLALALGVHARRSGPWAVVGIVTSVLAIVLSLAIVILGILFG